MLVSLKTFCALIYHDMRVFRAAFFDRLINAAIWISLNVVVFQYIFSKMGMSTNYGAFMACGNIMSNGLFDIMGNVARFVSDIEGDKTIGYELTLPLPHWLVMFRIAISNALQAMSVGIFILPLAKIFLWNQLLFTNTSWAKFALIFIIAHLLYGYFSLCIASYMKNLWGIENIWTRVIFPLWWLGGFQFSWKTLFGISPQFAYISLLNPLTMCFEGMRGAVLGQEEYLPFWGCFFALVVWTVIVGYIGTKRMMKRLDCVI